MDKQAIGPRIGGVPAPFNTDYWVPMAMLLREELPEGLRDVSLEIVTKGFLAWRSKNLAYEERQRADDRSWEWNPVIAMVHPRGVVVSRAPDLHDSVGQDVNQLGRFVRVLTGREVRPRVSVKITLVGPEKSLQLQIVL